MWELYFLTRLSCIQTVCAIMILVSLVMLAGYFSLLISSCDQESSDEIRFLALSKTMRNWGLSLLIAGGLGVVFVPSTKDMLLIYGGGTIMEYCQDNKEIKQIPDKTVTIINSLLDEYIKEQNKEE